MKILLYIGFFTMFMFYFKPPAQNNPRLTEFPMIAPFIRQSMWCSPKKISKQGEAAKLAGTTITRLETKRSRGCVVLTSPPYDVDMLIQNLTKFTIGKI